MRRLFVIPVNECAFQARRREEVQTTRLALLQLAMAAIRAHVPPGSLHLMVVASQACPETTQFLQEAYRDGRIQDLVLSTANIEHGIAMDIATHHGVSRWHDVFYCQDMDVELLSGDLIEGVEARILRKEADVLFDSITPITHYGNQVVPARPLCCMLAGSCARRVRFPVSLEHIQGEIEGRDRSPLRLDRMWGQCARDIRRNDPGWNGGNGRREFHTDTGYAFMRLAPLWGLKVLPLPDKLRDCYVHRGYLSPRYGLSDITYSGRTVAEHLDEACTRLREVYGEEPVSGLRVACVR